VITNSKQLIIRKRIKRAVRKHTVLLLTQIMFAAITTILWYFIIWQNELHIDREDSEFFVAGVIFLASAAWVLKGTEVLRVIWDQYRDVSTAVKRGDRTTIIELRDEHIPLLMHYYLTMLAVIADLVMMLMPYKHVWDGAAAVFLVTLVFTFFAALILELEDPTETGWIRAQIEKHDPSLLNEDCEKVFDGKWKRHHDHT